MRKEYIADYTETTPKYDKKASYLNTTEREGDVPPYIVLTEDYDIFSEVDKAFIYRTDTKQFKLISLCFRFLQNQLVALMKEDRQLRRDRVLPKVIMTQGDNGSIAFNWAFSSFRATLLFESEEDNNSAYCNIVFQKTVGSISIQTDEVNENNYSQVMNKLLYSVIDNS